MTAYGCVRECVRSLWAKAVVSLDRFGMWESQHVEYDEKTVAVRPLADIRQHNDTEVGGEVVSVADLTRETVVHRWGEDGCSEYKEIPVAPQICSPPLTDGPGWAGSTREASAIDASPTQAHSSWRRYHRIPTWMTECAYKNYLALGN